MLNGKNYGLKELLDRGPRGLLSFLKERVNFVFLFSNFFVSGVESQPCISNNKVGLLS